MGESTFGPQNANPEIWSFFLTQKEEDGTGSTGLLRRLSNSMVLSNNRGHVCIPLLILISIKDLLYPCLWTANHVKKPNLRCCFSFTKLTLRQGPTPRSLSLGSSAWRLAFVHGRSRHYRFRSSPCSRILVKRRLSRSSWSPTARN